MSEHADTIREYIEDNPSWGSRYSRTIALESLDALLAENQRLRDALERIRDGVQPDNWSRNEAREALAGATE